MADIDLTIGLVNYNTKKYLEGCLNSIFNQPCRYSIEVVMVDNASKDGSIEWVRSQYPQVRVIANKNNVGIARGNNQAIIEGNGRYVFLLNTDTILLPGGLEKQIEFLDRHPEAGAVGGRLIFEDGSFQSSYDSFPYLWMEFLGITWLGKLFNPRFPSNPDCDETKAVDWISSASLTVRKSAVEQIGLIDEKFFIYGDETDLQFRMTKAGWKIYFLPDVETIHFGGRSLDRWKRRRLVCRGKILYYHKNKGKFQAFILRSMFLIAASIKIPFWLILGIIPGKRDRAQKEVKSNIDIVHLCFRPFIRLANEYQALIQSS